MESPTTSWLMRRVAVCGFGEVMSVSLVSGAPRRRPWRRGTASVRRPVRCGFGRVQIRSARRVPERVDGVVVVEGVGGVFAEADAQVGVEGQRLERSGEGAAVAEIHQQDRTGRRRSTSATPPTRVATMASRWCMASSRESGQHLVLRTEHEDVCCMEIGHDLVVWARLPCEMDVGCACGLSRAVPGRIRDRLFCPRSIAHIGLAGHRRAVS